MARGGPPSPEQVIGDFAKSGVPPVSVWAGPEKWFGDQAVKAARAAFLGEDEEGFSSLRAPQRPGDSEGTPLLAAITEGRTVPMFGGRRLVAWRGKSLSAEEGAALARAAEGASTYVRFLVLVDEVGKDAAKALKKSGATIVECRRLFDTPWTGRPEWDTALDKWTTSRAGLHGLRLSLPVAHVLTQAVGNDLGAIDGALAKLALLRPAGGPLHEDDLAPVIGGGRDFDAFAFGDALYGKDAPRAYQVVQRAFRDGIVEQDGGRTRNPGAIAARLLWSVQYRLEQVYEAARMLADGKSEEEAALKIGRGKRTPAADRAVRAAAVFGLSGLRRHQLLLTAAQAETRTVVPEDVILARLVAEIAGAPRG